MDEQQILKIGDTVMISRSSIHYGGAVTSNNPKYITGKIIEISDISNYNIKVLWSNSHNNDYNHRDLILFKRNNDIEDDGAYDE